MKIESVESIDFLKEATNIEALCRDLLLKESRISELEIWAESIASRATQELKMALLDIAGMEPGHECKCQCANHCIEYAQEVLKGLPLPDWYRPLTNEEEEEIWKRIERKLKNRV